MTAINLVLDMKCSHGIHISQTCVTCKNDGHISGVAFDLAAWNKQLSITLADANVVIASQYFSSDPMIKLFAQSAAMQIETIKNQLRILMLSKSGNL